MTIIGLGIFAVSGGGVSYAQSINQTPAPTMSKKTESNQSTAEDISREMTIMRDEYAGKYNTSSLENLSKLYWRLGAFDTDDEKSIESFIRINDCKVYTKYIGDEIEWKKITASMKNYLEKEKNNFPLNYQFTIELNLGKYNIDKGGFEVVNNTGFENSKLIHINSVYQNRVACGERETPKMYPKSVIMLLENPFTMNLVKLDEHVAQAFILRKKEDPRRTAFLRIRINFDQYVGNLRGTQNETYAVMHGKIDGYEIFEDVHQKNLLLSVNGEDVYDKTLTGSYTQPAIQNTAQNPSSDNPIMTGFTAAQ